MAATQKSNCIVCGAKALNEGTSSLQKYFHLASTFQEELTLEHLNDRGVCQSCEINVNLAGNGNERVEELEKELDELASSFHQKLKGVIAAKKQVRFALQQMQESMKGRKGAEGLEQADVHFRKATEKALTKTKEAVLELEANERCVENWICENKEETSAVFAQPGASKGKKLVSVSSAAPPPSDFELEACNNVEVKKEVEIVNLEDLQDAKSAEAPMEMNEGTEKNEVSNSELVAMESETGPEMPGPSGAQTSVLDGMQVEKAPKNEALNVLDGTVPKGENSTPAQGPARFSESEADISQTGNETQEEPQASTSSTSLASGEVEDATPAQVEALRRSERKRKAKDLQNYECDSGKKLNREVDKNTSCKFCKKYFQNPSNTKRHEYYCQMK